ncbi:hypothetical protein MASR2M18_13990 [Ignavibacteria bacterium]|nr:hypothetical protein [Bacteroidota bacterium]MCZ2133205.1 hypothetical protein [Bacteroidota bacterium]
MQIEHAPHERGAKSAPHKLLQTAVQQLWDTLYRSGEFIVALREDNASLSETTVRLEKEAELRRQNYDELAVQFARLQEQNRRFEERAADIRQREEMQVQIDEALSEKDKQIVGLNDKVDELCRELKDIRDEAESRAQAIAYRDRQLDRLENAERENKSLRDELGELEQFRMNMEIIQKELARRNSELNARLNETQQYRNRVAELENKLFCIPKLEDEIAAAKSRMAELEDEIARLQKDHHQASEYSRLYDIQQATLEAYSQKNLEYNIQLTARIKELDDVREQMGDIERKLADERAITEKLHVELRSAREYESQISKHLASLEQYAGQIVEVKKLNHVQEEQIKDLTELLEQSEKVLKAEIAAKFETQEILQTLSAKYETACANIEKQEATGVEMEGTITALRHEIEQKTAANELLQKEYDALQSALKAAVSAKSELSSALSEQTAAAEKLSEDMVALRNESVQLRRELSELSIASAESERLLRGELSAKQDSIVEAQATDERLRQEIEALCSEIKRVETEFATATENHDVAALELQNLISQKTAETKQLAEQSNERFTEIERLKSEIFEMKVATAERDKTHDAEMRMLSGEVEVKTLEIKRMSGEIVEAWKSADDQRGIREVERERFEGEKQSFLAEIREKEVEIKRLVERIALLESDYAREKGRTSRNIDLLNAQIEELNAQIAEKDLRIEALAAGSDAMRDELEQGFVGSRAKEAHLREKAELLQTKLDEEERQFKRLVKDNVALRKEIDEQRVQAAQLTERLQSEQSAMRKAIEAAEARYSALSDEKKNADDMLAVYREAQQDSTRLYERNAELESEVHSLTVELSKTRQALHQANQKISETAVPADIAAPSGDQRDKVLGKIGDILSRLEGALQEEQ